jgi:hypothetical protein
MSLSEYQSLIKSTQEKENAKKPGQIFCDKYGWRLSNKFKLIQRPDKITYSDGSLWRTTTPITHVWYQNITTLEHILIEFTEIGKGSIKRNVSTKTIAYSSLSATKIHIFINKYKSIHYFNSNDDAIEYLLS